MKNKLYIYVSIFILAILICCKWYFNKKEFIPYNQEILDNLTNKYPLYMYVPLNKLMFSQSRVYKNLSDDESINSYSMRIKNNYNKTNQIDFVNTTLRKFCKKMNNIVFINVNLLLNDSNKYFLKDGVHPSRRRRVWVSSNTVKYHRSR
jgi:hypothetical protein